MQICKTTTTFDTKDETRQTGNNANEAFEDLKLKYSRAKRRISNLK